MRRFLIAAAVLSTTMAFSQVSRAADSSEQQTVKGVLIDKSCGTKQMKKDDPQAAAADHDKDCAIKCGKKGGYAVISGKKMWVLDADSNKKAQTFLEKHDSTKVTVKGTEKGDTLTIESIEETK